MSTLDDAELVRQALAGRREAYGTLARRWAPRALAVCHAKTGRSDLAEDLAQEALLRGLRALGTLGDSARFGPWLLGIARRVCLDWLKAKARGTLPFGALGHEEGGDAFPSSAAGGAEEAERDESLARLMSEVERLPPRLREALFLFYHEDLSYKDIASLCGCSPATVNQRLTEARQLLRARLVRAEGSDA